MAVDWAGLRLADKIDIDVGRDRQRFGASVGKHAYITSNVGQGKKRGAGNGIAGTQMTVLGVEPHHTAAREDLDRLVEIVVLVELWKDLRQHCVDFIDGHDWRKIGLGWHADLD